MRRGKGRTGLGRAAGWGVLAVSCLVLANCSETSKRLGSRVDPKYGVTASPRVVEDGQPIPKGGGTFRVGKPYTVAGKTYVPEDNKRFRSEGIASWYGSDFHGRLTANGEVYDMHGISAAHPTLPMPSYVRVTNVNNRKSLIVRVNDRGPYHGNRVIDLSGKAAELLGFRGNGLAKVRVEYVGPAALEGSDDRRLAATLRDGEPAPAPSTVMVAAAKPFVPEIASRSPALRGAVPVPSARPYDLGQDADAAPTTPVRSAALPSPASTEVSAVSRPRMVWQEGPVGQPATSPVSAFAPVRHDGGAAMSGRGLY